MKITELFDKPRTMIEFIPWIRKLTEDNSTDNEVLWRIFKAHEFLSLNAKDAVTRPEEPKKTDEKFHTIQKEGYFDKMAYANSYLDWQNRQCPFLGQPDLENQFILKSGNWIVFTKKVIWFQSNDKNIGSISIDSTMEDIIRFCAEKEIQIEFDPEYEL